MSAAENKEVIRNLWAEASKGNAEGFLSGLADDVCYTIIGTTHLQWKAGAAQSRLHAAYIPTRN